MTSDVESSTSPLPGAPPQVFRYRDADQLTAAAAARLITRISQAQAERGTAHVVLTGGRNGIGMLSALRMSPERDAIDFSTLHLWWGDERFLPSGSTDRNDAQADEALLSHVEIPPENVHRMAASEGPDGDNPDPGAERYADELAAFAAPTAHLRVPKFDVLLLGVGPDGHVASLFPQLPGMDVQDATVISVRDSPKPPPIRISLTLPAIQSADEVWLVASGLEKAPVIARAVNGDLRLPAAHARGRSQTVWLVDEAGAADLPNA